MPWNWTSSWSLGLSPRGPLTNSVRVPARANSSISTTCQANLRASRSGA